MPTKAQDRVPRKEEVNTMQQLSTFKRRLTRAFALARQRDYFARQSWQCCQSCGCAALPDGIEHYVFYHRQDAEHMADAARRLERPYVYLSWKGDGHELRRIFVDAGLAVEWDGTTSQRIKVIMPPTQEDRDA